MADNVIIDLMSGGSTVATDNVTDVHHQLVKIEYGTDGAATMVSSSNPLPVSGISGTTSVNTPGTITSGSVSVIAGTVGTVGAVAQVHNAGTIAGGTIGILTDGTIRVAAGSIAVTAGTIGTVASVAQVHNAGTIAGGTLAILTDGTVRIPAGTISVNTPGTITSGTIAVNAGTVIMTAGTVNSGTINAGTINAGTIRNDGRPARNILSFGTTIAFGGSAFATLVGSTAIGAGTSLWINDLSIVNHGGTVQAGIVFGSAINGSAVIAKGQFASQGGIEKPFPMAVNAGMTNTDLNAWADGASTVTFNVSYFISA